MENRQLAELIRRYYPFKKWLEDSPKFHLPKWESRLWALFGLIFLVAGIASGIGPTHALTAWKFPLVILGLIMFVIYGIYGLDTDNEFTGIGLAYWPWKARMRRAYEQQLRENPYAALLILKTVTGIEAETGAKHEAAKKAVEAWLKMLTGKRDQLAEIAETVRAELDGGLEADDQAVRDLLAAAVALLPQLESDISEARECEQLVTQHYRPVEELVGQLRHAYRRASQVEAIAEAQALLGTDQYRLACQTKIGDLRAAVVSATLNLEEITNLALARLQAQQEVGLITLAVENIQQTSA